MIATQLLEGIISYKSIMISEIFKWEKSCVFYILEDKFRTRES